MTVPPEFRDWMNTYYYGKTPTREAIEKLILLLQAWVDKMPK